MVNGVHEFASHLHRMMMRSTCHALAASVWDIALLWEYCSSLILRDPLHLCNNDSCDVAGFNRPERYIWPSLCRKRTGGGPFLSWAVWMISLHWPDARIDTDQTAPSCKFSTFVMVSWNFQHTSRRLWWVSSWHTGNAYIVNKYLQNCSKSFAGHAAGLYMTQ